MEQTTLSKPDWWAINASVLPSTSTATPDLRMALLALSMRNSVRPLSKSGVCGVLRYLGPVSGPCAPRMRPVMPVAPPAASRMGKMTRARKRS